MQYLLSIDPGLMTGLSFFDISDMSDPKLLWTKEATIEDFYEKIPGLVADVGESLEIVCENFLITVATAKKTQAPWSLELIGLVRYLCWLHKATLTLHKPGDREFMTKDKLKKFGFWHRGGEGHAIVSLQHAGVWLVTKNGKLAKKLLS